MVRFADRFRVPPPHARDGDRHRTSRARRSAGVAMAGVVAIGVAAGGTARAADEGSGARQTPAAFGEPGQHAVGYQHLRAPGGLEVHAWYPTARRSPGESDGEIRYVVRNKFSSFLPGRNITNLGRATEGAEPDRGDGPYPLVVLSPGASLSPTFYSTLVEHYVSHGMVVLGPEHDEAYQPGQGWNARILFDRPRDISTTVDLAERLTSPGNTLAGLIDTSRVAVVGHSFGGYTALAAAGARLNLAPHFRRCAQLDAKDPRTHFCVPLVGHEREMARSARLRTAPKGLWPSMRDPRITSIVSMAGDAYMFDTAGLSSLHVPVMAMGGTDDIGTPYDWGAKLTYRRAASPIKSLVTFTGADHMIFGAPCARLPWVGKTPYGTRGFCEDPVWRKGVAQRLVKQYSTAFLKATLRCDDAARSALRPPSVRIPRFTYAASPATTEDPCRQ